jgi:hypothetical protein
VLIGATSPPATRPRATRRRVVLAALAPTARVANLGSAGLTVALGAIPVVVTVTRGDAVVSAPLIIVCVVGGAALGWGVEDPVADLFAPLPLSSPVRATVRLLFVALVATIGVALALVVVALGARLPVDVLDRVPEAAAAAALAVAVGFVAVRRGERAAGPAGVTAGVLGAAFVAALAYRWPTVFPMFAVGPTHDRWWLLAIAGFAVAIRAGRDPSRR